MKFTVRKTWIAAVGLALVAATGGIAVAAGEDLDWFTADNAAVVDPNASGGALKLVNAAGTEITSGSTSAPLAAFAVADEAQRSGDQFATLYAHQARSDTARGAWTGIQVTGTDKFAGAGAITVPVADKATVDLDATGVATLADVAAGFATGAGTYQNIYELRLRSSSPTKGLATSYASVLVKITGSTWQKVTSLQETPTSQTVGAVPTTAAYGAAIKVPVTVTSTPIAAGTVQVKKGATVLASGTLASNGKATLTIAAGKLGVGKHSLTTVYLGSASVSGSTSAVKQITIAKAKPKVAIKLVKATIKKGKTASVAVTITVPGVAGPTGKIVIYNGTKPIKSVTLAAAKKGKITIVLPKFTKVGKAKILAKYAGSTVVAPGNSVAVTLTVTK